MTDVQFPKILKKGFGFRGCFFPEAESSSEVVMSVQTDYGLYVLATNPVVFGKKVSPDVADAAKLEWLRRYPKGYSQADKCQWTVKMDFVCEKWVHEIVPFEVAAVTA